MGKCLPLPPSVAQDTTTKKCKMVKKKPYGAALIIIGQSSHPTKEDARSAKRAAEACPKVNKDAPSIEN